MSAASCARNGAPPDGDGPPAQHAEQGRAAGVLKVVVGDANTPAAARARAARVGEVDYGSFHLLLVDEKAAGGRAALDGAGVELRDDMNEIALEGLALDTRHPADVEARLPQSQRRDELAAARAARRPPHDGLYLVQFVGPVRDAWLDGLTRRGLELVTYVPENAYVVRARGAATAALLTLDTQQPEVQFVGDFHPAYRLSAGLQPLVASAISTPVDVTVQILDDADAAAHVAELGAGALAFVQEHPVLAFRNVELTLDSARLEALLHKEWVVHIEERTSRRKLDEVQGQILANNLIGNNPSGPGYLAWLVGKGFNATQFSSFSVHVVDDTYTLAGHPDLPPGRVAFIHNVTNMSGSLGGHGFLNSHIVGGFNDAPAGDSAHLDANGFHYGLGISPFARVGATAIFGSGSATSTSWENSGFGSGARISSNSWGFTGAAAKRYDSNSQEYDVIVRDSQNAVSGLQPMIVVFAAGNDGSAGANGGPNTVSSPGTAKNVLTVGAGENVRQTGTDGCLIDNSGANSANDIIYFSSRGPVNAAGGDGRVKPDIMAPGTHIEAGVPQSNYDGSSVCDGFWPLGQTLYGWSSGTSHSTPATAGSASLVYQDFLNHGRPAPSPAMAKAYLMNSASYMTGVDANDTLPSNHQGMGRVNLGRAFDGVGRIFVDQTETLGASGETRVYTGSITTASQPFRVTLAWTDAPGPLTGAPWVNNLDLEVTVNGTTYKGNVFSGQSSVGGGAADTKDNVESVFLPAGASGTFTVTVRGTNIAGDGVPGNSDLTDQDFALVIYNGGSGSATDPTIGVSPAMLSFSGTAGGPNPAAQALTISNSGAGTLDWSATSTQPWLSANPTSGTAPSTTSIAVDLSGLSAGSYDGAITISGTGATNSPVVVPVHLTVAPMPTPLIGVSPASLSFAALTTGPAPDAKTLTVSNDGVGTLEWAVTADAAWLSAAPGGGIAPSSVTVVVTPAGLEPGTYHGNLVFSAAGAANSPVTVPVTLVVSLPPSTISVSPASLSFNGTAEGDNPASQTVAIDNSGPDGSVLDWSASANAPWLSLSPTSGRAPSTMTVAVSTVGLAAGTYTANITLAAANSSNAPLTIPVTLTVAVNPSGDLVVNGGFERGLLPWVLTGQSQRGVGASPHTGSAYAVLGGGVSSTGAVYQTVAIPAMASPQLSFWLNVTTRETGAGAYDKLFVEVRSTSGALLATLATFSNQQASADSGTYTQRGGFDVSAFKGQTIRLQLRATNDIQSATTFRIDDVVLK